MTGWSTRPRTKSRSRSTSRLAATLLVGLTSLLLGFGFWLGGAPQRAAAAGGDCSIGDFVWHDRIYNGLQDPGEAGVAGVTVTLLGADGESVGVEPETTDAQGKWAFTGIACDEYVVQFSDIPGPSTFTKAWRGMIGPRTRMRSGCPATRELDGPARSRWVRTRRTRRTTLI